MPTTEISNSIVATLFVNILGKLFVIDQTHQLCKDIFTSIH